VGSNAQTQRRFERSAVTLTRMEVMRTGEVCGLEIHESDFHSAAGCRRDGDALPLSGRSSAQVHRLHEQDFYGTAGCQRGQGALPHAGRSRAQGHRLRARARWFRRGQDCWSGPPGLAKVTEDTMTVHSGEVRLTIRARLAQEDNHFCATWNIEGEENHSMNVNDDQGNHSGNTNDEPELLLDNAAVVNSADVILTLEEHLGDRSSTTHVRADKMTDIGTDHVIQHGGSEGEGAQAYVCRAWLSGDPPQRAEGSDGEEKVANVVGKGSDFQPDNEPQHMDGKVAGVQASSRMAHDLGKDPIIQPFNVLRQAGSVGEDVQAGSHMAPISRALPQTAEGSDDDEEVADAVGTNSDLQLDNVLQHNDGEAACAQASSHMAPISGVPPHTAKRSDGKEEEEWAGVGFGWEDKPSQQRSKWVACTQAAEVAIGDALGRNNQGNTALANGQLEDAAQLYVDGQCRIGRHCMQYETCGGEVQQRLVSTSVALHNNLALALLRIAERAEIASDATEAVAWYDSALDATIAALGLEPHNAKAQHRRQIALAKIEKLGIDMS